jgi:DNA-binding PadR family transcriptional regulator
MTALVADPAAWRYGYELGQEVGLKTGTLYPILIRLCDQGLLEASWETGTPQGRPPRHLYRLTAAGLHRSREFAPAAASSAPRAAGETPAPTPTPTPTPTPAPAPRTSGRRGELRGAW